MKISSIVVAAALACGLCGPVAAAVVHVSGQGQSYDPGIALADARADAASRCAAQGGTPVAEVYNHVTRTNLWSASSIWTCEVP